MPIADDDTSTGCCAARLENSGRGWPKYLIYLSPRGQGVAPSFAKQRAGSDTACIRLVCLWQLVEFDTGKAALFGARLYLPVPCRYDCCIIPKASSLTYATPPLSPLKSGVNVTFSVHVAPTCRVDGQSFVLL